MISNLLCTVTLRNLLCRKSWTRIYSLEIWQLSTHSNGIVHIRFDRTNPAEERWKFTYWARRSRERRGTPFPLLAICSLWTHLNWFYCPFLYCFGKANKCAAKMFRFVAQLNLLVVDLHCETRGVVESTAQKHKQIEQFIEKVNLPLRIL